MRLVCSSEHEEAGKWCEIQVVSSLPAVGRSVLVQLPKRH